MLENPEEKQQPATGLGTDQHKSSMDINCPSSDLITASSATTAAESTGPKICGNNGCRGGDGGCWPSCPALSSPDSFN